MARRPDFRILSGVDGSAQARAALATLVTGPWPDDSRVRAVAARQTGAPYRRSLLLSALDRTAEDVAERARETLARRWPHAEAVVLDTTPVKGILDEAGRFHADIIAVGWRGHGPVRRLLMGSVSRGVVRGATCAVLIVGRPVPTGIRHIVIGFDGSANARSAVKLVARLSPPRDGRVTLVGAVELLEPTSSRPPVGGIRGSVARGLKQINKERTDAARQALDRAEAMLTRAGWRTRTDLRIGEPLRELMDSLAVAKADLLVIGARGTSRVRQLLLGSVAEGALSRSPVPVLIAR